MAQAKNFSIKEAFIFGFNALFTNMGFFFKVNLIFICIGAGILLFLIPLMTTIATMHSYSGSTLITIGGLLVQVLSSLLSYLIEEYYLFVITCSGLSIYDSKPLTLDSLWNLDDFFNFFGARLLFAIKCFLGFLLLIVPGIYIFCKYYLTGFPLIDGKAQTITQDSSRAGHLTKGVRWKIFWFQILNYLLLCLAGLFILSVFGGPLLIAYNNFHRNMFFTAVLVILSIVAILVAALIAPIFILNTVYIYRTLENVDREDILEA